MIDDYINVYDIDKIIQKIDSDEIYSLINEDTYNDVLSISIKRKKLKIVKYIIYNYKCDCIDIELKTPLHLSIIYQIESDIIEFLLTKVNVNLQDIFGNTALHYAMALSDEVLISQLLRFGAHPLIPNNNKNNCIYYSNDTKRKLLLDNLNMRKLHRELNNDFLFSPIKCMNKNNYLSK